MKYSLAPADSTITVGTPNGSESWQAGTARTITWNYTGNPGSFVKIDLYKGTSLNRTITSSTSAGSGGSGSYSWPIPADVIAGTDYRVNVTSTSYSSVSDMSDNYFTIIAVPPFSASGSVSNSGTGLSGVTMTFSRVSGSGTTPSSVTTDSGGYWSQSGFQPGTTYKATPSQTGYTFTPSYRDFSGHMTELNFTGTPVVPPGITLVTPNGGESLKVGTPYAVTWNYTGTPGSKVKIELLRSGAPISTITTKASIGTAGKGTYNWKPSRSLTPGGYYRLRVTSTTNGSVTDTSEGNFSIYK